MMRAVVVGGGLAGLAAAVAVGIFFSVAIVTTIATGIV